MHCKRCGKAIGTDRGICPFCGAMLSKEQLEIYKKDQQENYFKPKLLTEKYGEKPIVYEKRKEPSNMIFLILSIIAVLTIIAIVVLILVLNY